MILVVILVAVAASIKTKFEPSAGQGTALNFVRFV